jgi:hypothetical protein
VGVEKVRDRNVFPGVMIAAEFLISRQLRGGIHSGRCRLAEEPHQSLDVLGRRRQEESLSHELQSAQAQATQPDQILQFREQGFYLLSLPLGMGELGRVHQLPCTFPRANYFTGNA